MKSNKNHGVKKDNDLNFVPLDIQEPFKFNSSTLSPIIKYDGTAITATSSDIFIGFPPLSNNLDGTLIDSTQSTPVPLMPYPISTPTLEPTDINNKNINTKKNVTSDTELQYLSEVDSNDLYSYNKPRVNDDYLHNIINPIDILRNFDLQDDIVDNTNRGGYTAEDIDSIFKNIESNNSSILAVMKTYRIPYPIAKLIVKRIIKLTLDYSKR